MPAARQIAPSCRSHGHSLSTSTSWGGVSDVEFDAQRCDDREKLLHRDASAAGSLVTTVTPTRILILVAQQAPALSWCSWCCRCHCRHPRLRVPICMHLPTNSRSTKRRWRDDPPSPSGPAPSRLRPRLGHASKAPSPRIWARCRADGNRIVVFYINGLSAGWGARIRTWEWRNQNPLPYHLATPHRGRSATRPAEATRTIVKRTRAGNPVAEVRPTGPLPSAAASGADQPAALTFGPLATATTRP